MNSDSDISYYEYCLHIVSSYRSCELNWNFHALQQCDYEHDFFFSLSEHYPLMSLCAFDCQDTGTPRAYSTKTLTLLLVTGSQTWSILLKQTISQSTFLLPFHFNLDPRLLVSRDADMFAQSMTFDNSQHGQYQALNASWDIETFWFQIKIFFGHWSIGLRIKNCGILGVLWLWAFITCFPNFFSRHSIRMALLSSAFILFPKNQILLDRK